MGAARQAVGPARNTEAVNLFERTLTVMPGRRRNLRWEYADQVLYARELL
jgi:hypothetical protein